MAKNLYDKRDPLTTIAPRFKNDPSITRRSWNELAELTKQSKEQCLNGFMGKFDTIGFHYKNFLDYINQYRPCDLFRALKELFYIDFTYVPEPNCGDLLTTMKEMLKNIVDINMTFYRYNTTLVMNEEIREPTMIINGIRKYDNTNGEGFNIKKQVGTDYVDSDTGLPGYLIEFIYIGNNKDYNTDIVVARYDQNTTFCSQRVTDLFNNQDNLNLFADYVKTGYIPKIEEMLSHWIQTIKENNVLPSIADIRIVFNHKFIYSPTELFFRFTFRIAGINSLTPITTSPPTLNTYVDLLGNKLSSVFQITYLYLERSLYGSLIDDYIRDKTLSGTTITLDNPPFFFTGYIKNKLNPIKNVRYVGRYMMVNKVFESDMIRDIKNEFSLRFNNIDITDLKIAIPDMLNKIKANMGFTGFVFNYDIVYTDSLYLTTTVHYY